MNSCVAPHVPLRVSVAALLADVLMVLCILRSDSIFAHRAPPAFPPFPPSLVRGTPAGSARHAFGFVV